MLGGKLFEVSAIQYLVCLSKLWSMKWDKKCGSVVV